MRRVPRAWLLAAAAAGAGILPLAAQGLTQPSPAPPPVRDAPPVLAGRGPGEPVTRMIPVGTAAISGTVVAADSGRPLSGARVMLNGTLQSGGLVPGTAAAQIPGPGGPISTGMAMGVSRTTTTNAQGQFSIDRLPAGRFTVNVTRMPYLMGAYGQKRPGGRGTPIAIADGQRARVNLQMIRGGVITGTVIGDDGEPVANAQVRLWRYGTDTGVRRLQSTNGSSTDDRGVYRLHGLQPGDYVVSATPNNFDMMADRSVGDQAAIEEAIASGTVRSPTAPGAPAMVQVTVTPPQPGPMQQPMPAYLPTYFPGTPVVTDATPVHVNAGEERSGVDVPVRLVRASAIQGTIAAAVAQGVAVQVTVQPDDPAIPMTMNSTRIGPEGRFSLGNLAPGKYTVLAYTVPMPTMGMGSAFPGSQAGPPRLDDSQKLWARTVVMVEPQSVTSVSLSLQPGRSISGHVLYEVARPPDLMQAKMMVSLNSAPGMITGPFNVSQASVGSDGRFTIAGVIPGRYVLRTSGGMTKSSVLNGQDTLDFPLDFSGDRDITDAVITVTDKSSEVSGTLTDANGKPVFDYMILAVAADQQFWTPQSRRILIAQPATDGAYTLRGLPPGDYMLAAVSDLEPGGQYDPELLRTLIGAPMRITIGEGQKVSQNLRVAK